MSTREQIGENWAAQRYRAVFEQAAVGIALVGVDGSFLAVNNKVCAITGYTREELLSRGFQRITHPDDLEADLSYVRQLLAGEIDSYSMEKRYIHRTGGPVWINLTGSLVRTGEGEPEFFVATIEDISARKRAEAELADSEARLRLMLDQLFALVGVLTPEGVLLHANEAPLAAAGITLADVQGRKFDEAYWWSYDPDVQAQLRHAMGRAREGEVVRYDVPVRMAGERLMHIDFQVAPLRSERGELIGLIASAIDIDERKAGERHRELLIGELNHRVKNTLTIVQSMAVQSFRSLPQGEGRVRDFEQRLLALSGAHNLLTQSNWDAASMDDVISQAIKAASPEAKRVHMDGPPVLLPPKAAVTLALAVHELCTNAIKYGALSGDGGHIDVTWGLPDPGGDALWLEWREIDGPAVTAPTRKGFGSRLIERALAMDLNGTVRMDFLPTGLVCRLEGKVPGKVEPIR